VAEDWIYFGEESPGRMGSETHFIFQSPIGKYLGGGIQTNLFRCPSDTKSLSGWPNLDGGLYPFSYSLSSGYIPGEFQMNFGMASQFIDTFVTRNGGGKFKMQQVMNPNEKIVMAEDWGPSEAPPDERGLSYIFDTSGFLWRNGDRLSKRHLGRANVFFPDGRVEIKSQAYGDHLEHTDPVF
jgi:prepilin-type processing-associated H-X9-DG protein